MARVTVEHRPVAFGVLPGAKPVAESPDVQKDETRSKMNKKRGPYRQGGHHPEDSDTRHDGPAAAQA